MYFLAVPIQEPAFFNITGKSLGPSTMMAIPTTIKISAYYKIIEMETKIRKKLKINYFEHLKNNAAFRTHAWNRNGCR